MSQPTLAVSEEASALAFHVSNALSGSYLTDHPHAKLRLFAAYFSGMKLNGDDAAKLRAIIDASHNLP